VNRGSVAALVLIALAFAALWFYEPRAAVAAPAPTYEFRLVTAGTSPDDLIRTLNGWGSQGFRAVGLVCLGNTNQYSTSACVAQILMERQRR
jgi:hypothetical protein